MNCLDLLISHVLTPTLMGQGEALKMFLLRINEMSIPPQKNHVWQPPSHAIGVQGWGLFSKQCFS